MVVQSLDSLEVGRRQLDHNRTGLFSCCDLVIDPYFGIILLWLTAGGRPVALLIAPKHLLHRL
jgi:hypothetical protein